MRRSVRSFCLVATAVLSAALASSPRDASAAERSINFSPSGLGLLGSAIMSSASTDLILPKLGAASFTLHVVLPRDYKLNSGVRIHVYAFGFADCSANLIVESASRRRVGSMITDTTNGITPQNGTNAISFLNGGRIAQKVFLVRRPTNGSLGGQQRPGDGLRLTFLRDSTDPIDTCTGDVRITHVELRYTPDP